VSIVSDLLAAIPFLNKLGRKKPFVLWFEGPDRKPYLLSHFVILREGVSPGPGFVKKSTPMSYRQCEKTRDALWMLGP
jgi:hypothetical protein